jgi:hypothetical protein
VVLDTKENHNRSAYDREVMFRGEARMLSAVSCAASRPKGTSAWGGKSVVRRVTSVAKVVAATPWPGTGDVMVSVFVDDVVEGGPSPIASLE